MFARSPTARGSFGARWTLALALVCVAGAHANAQELGEGFWDLPQGNQGQIQGNTVLTIFGTDRPLELTGSLSRLQETVKGGGSISDTDYELVRGYAQRGQEVLERSVETIGGNDSLDALLDDALAEGTSSGGVQPLQLKEFTDLVRQLSDDLFAYRMAASLASNSDGYAVVGAPQGTNRGLDPSQLSQLTAQNGYLAVMRGRILDGTGRLQEMLKS